MKLEQLNISAHALKRKDMPRDGNECFKAETVGVIMFLWVLLL